MPITIEGEETININGNDYWTVQQFAKLTERDAGTIRMLITKGNRIRKIKTVHIATKPLILAEELFEFPFVIMGRPDSFKNSTCITRYYIDKDGDLTCKEEQYNWSPKEKEPVGVQESESMEESAVEDEGTVDE